jgi:hypothetical protein
MTKTHYKNSIVYQIYPRSFKDSNGESHNFNNKSRFT